MIIAYWGTGRFPFISGISWEDLLQNDKMRVQILVQAPVLRNFCSFCPNLPSAHPNTPAETHACFRLSA